MKKLFFILSLIILTIQLNAQTDSLTINIDSLAVKQTEAYEVIDPIEPMPKFPGDQDSLRTFIERNNNWRVGKETIVGKVFVGFVVEQDGSITNIEILKGLHKACDTEAKRIVSLMPNWKPAEIQGKPIRSKMMLPITFDGMK